jgi:hypothetical protein
VFIGLTLGFVLGETVLRVAGPDWLRQLMVGTNLDGEIHYGSDAGWPVETKDHKFLRFKPGKEFTVNYVEYKTVVHTDEWGGRSTSGPRRMDSERFIPLLGDSFAFGLGVNDHETFISLLAQQSNVACLNLAAPGSSLPNDLDIIQFRHQELGSPHVYVISFYLGNDFADMINYYETSKLNESAKKESEGAISKFIRQNGLLQKSYVAQFISQSLFEQSEKHKHRTRIFRAPGGQRLGNSLYLLMSHSKGYSSLASKTLDQTLNRLDQLSRTLHFTPVFIIIPDKHQTNQELFLKQAQIFQLPPAELDLYYPNRLVEENLERRGIAYLDVTSCLKDKPGLYYKMDDHLTVAGNRVVADCIGHDSKWSGIAQLRIREKQK